MQLTNRRKLSNLIKSHELICHFIILYLVPLPPQRASNSVQDAMCTTTVQWRNFFKPYHLIFVYICLTLSTLYRCNKYQNIQFLSSFFLQIQFRSSGNFLNELVNCKKSSIYLRNIIILQGFLDSRSQQRTDQTDIEIFSPKKLVFAPVKKRILPKKFNLYSM